MECEYLIIKASPVLFKTLANHPEYPKHQQNKNKYSTLYNN